MPTENFTMPKIPFWVFIILAIIHFSAIRVDVMDVDASQYAEISMGMMESGDYLHVYDRGRDYLDKPPFLFWVSALSMKIFGVNNFGYKLPSILFALWALFATYRLGRLLYGEAAGRMAALILGCCQGMFLMTNDIRTDTILMSWTITAIWLIREWEVSKRLQYLLLGAAAISFGMMTKGPIALMVPVFCFVSDWILKREWKSLFRPQYLLGLLVIAVLLIPMCIGLYEQFDMHPEKVIDGKTGTSGLRFFFWTQSFGRITGENIWSNGAPFSFLFENMLWSFLPWVLLFVLALILEVKQLIVQRFRISSKQEWLTTGGFILAYLSLGSSKYQLPHYIFVAFPLAALMVAKLLKYFFEGKYVSIYRFMKPVQMGLSSLLFVAAGLTFFFVFRGEVWVYIAWIISLAIWFILMLHLKTARIFWSGVVAIMAANIILTNHFYHTLVSQYQVGSKLGHLIRAQGITPSQVSIVALEDPVEAVHFYANGIVGRKDSSLVTSGEYLITDATFLPSLQQKGFRYEVLDAGEYFKVSELTPEFLNPATRSQAVRRYCFLRVL